MALESHIKELMERHKLLEHQIEQELLHPSSNDLHITELKRQKLRIKEEIARLSNAEAA